MRMIRLSKIGRTNVSSYDDSDDPTERPGEPTTPVVVNVEAIRCFYPRRENRPGTRITFTDGGGFAVSEPFQVVADAIGVGAAAAV